MSSNKSILNKTEVVDICSFCQKNFKPPNFESIFCDGCKTWIHLSCSGLSKHNFNFYSYNSDLFYCKYCAKNLSLKLLGLRTFVKIVLKDLLLMINVCIVRVVLNGYITNVLVYQKRILIKYVKMTYLFSVKLAV